MAFVDADKLPSFDAEKIVVYFRSLIASKVTDAEVFLKSVKRVVYQRIDIKREFQVKATIVRIVQEVGDLVEWPDP